MAQPSTIDILETLSEQMCARVPEDLLTDLILEGQQFQQAITFKRSIHIAQLILLIYHSVFFSLSRNWSLSEGGIVALGILNSCDQSGFGEVL